MAVTKKDLILRISSETGVKQIDAKRVVQKLLELVIRSLAAGETVELRNFGIFKVKSRRARMGRNPKTNAQVPVPQKKVAVFKPGLIMKRDVR